jgi:hypothetical protein
LPRTITHGAAASTPGALGRTGAFAVIIVAEMDHQIGPRRRRGLGDRGEWPSVGVVAILQRLTLDPAPGIAEDRDPAHRRGQGCQRHAADREACGCHRHPRLANPHRESSVRRTARQRRDGGAVRRHERAGSAGPNDGTDREGPIRAKFDPRRRQLRGPDG